MFSLHFFTLLAVFDFIGLFLLFVSFWGYFCCFTVFFSSNFCLFLFFFYNLFFVFVIFFYSCCFLLFLLLSWGLLVTFLLFFVYFLAVAVACGISVPQTGVVSETPVWEHWIQDNGQPENSSTQRILTIVCSPGGLHLSINTWFHPTACRLQFWMTQNRKPARQACRQMHQ